MTRQISTWWKMGFRPRPTRIEKRLLRELEAKEALHRRDREQQAALEEDVKKLRSVNRIQQAEIDELSAVVARNLERVKAETRELSGGPRIVLTRPTADEPTES